jgi:hypothetical protein
MFVAIGQRVFTGSAALVMGLAPFGLSQFHVVIAKTG